MSTVFPVDRLRNDALALVREPLTELGYSIANGVVEAVADSADYEASRIQAICRDIVLEVSPAEGLSMSTVLAIMMRTDHALALKEVENARKEVRINLWRRIKDDL